MNLQEVLELNVKAAAKALFDANLESVEFQATRKEFVGDITVVIFPMLRVIKGNPAVIGERIGEYLTEQIALVKSYNVVKGFLNIEVNDSYYLDFFKSILDNETYGYKSIKDSNATMVEYSSPNTNKPLHLGHVRNVLLGYSLSEILKASGKRVYKTQIINDRGIHICKSMLAWQRFGNGETPESSGLKGDKLVGKYYVKFEKVFQDEYSEWLESDSVGLEKYEKYKEFEKPARKALWEKIKDNENLKKEKKISTKDEYFSEDRIKKAFRTEYKDKYFNRYSKIGLDVKNMLRQWESGDEAVVALWETMNSWVYDGFEQTYKDIGVDFDKYYYESQTYLLGKEFISEGLSSGVFYKKEDGSVWCDLTDDGLDEKIVLRSDGTAVYMTQDIGTAIQRIKDYPDVGGMVYTVGNEQDYHFKVLFLILKKLGFEWAKNLYHLSYGMVDLPSGKMKSREGTVVDADDLITEMASTAEEISKELGKLDDYSEEDKKALYSVIGLGALKYYILKVDPKKRILFDPKESIDFQGNTGPFIQYTYARIQSILRKSNEILVFEDSIELHEKEKQLIKQLEQFPLVIQNAADQYSPALVANYTYDLVKDFNSFYQNVSILGANSENERAFRVALSKKVGETIKNAFNILGIDVPERM